MKAFEAGLLVYALVVLVPLVPALLIYKLAPGRQFASGPFRGLNIKATGAFAMYLVVAILTMPVVLRLDLPDGGSSLYVLRGQLQIENVRSREEFDTHALMINFGPRDESKQAAKTGLVSWAINVKAPPGVGEAVDWPFRFVVIEYPDHTSATFNIAEAVRSGDQEFDFPAPKQMKRLETQRVTASNMGGQN